MFAMNLNSTLFWERVLKRTVDTTECAKNIQVRKSVLFLGEVYGTRKFIDSSHQKYILVVPDNFIPDGPQIEIEGTTIGDESDYERYLYFDFSEYFGREKDSDGFKEVILQRGQFLGIAEGQIGYR